MENLLGELQKAHISTAKLSVNIEQIVAIKLYESFGFKTIAQEKKLMGDDNYHDEYLMEKKLA